VTPERWIANLIDVAGEIANKEKQEQRWLAPDAEAWERPEELINVLFDDSAFELFIDEYESTFVDSILRGLFQGQVAEKSFPTKYGFEFVVLRLEDVAAQVVVFDDRGDHLLHVIGRDGEDFFGAGGGHALLVGERGDGFVGSVPG
jgi:hypothetical protein